MTPKVIIYVLIALAFVEIYIKNKNEEKSYFCICVYDVFFHIQVYSNRRRLQALLNKPHDTQPKYGLQVYIYMVYRFTVTGGDSKHC